MKSMTGFGTSHGKKNNVEIEVNIKAVNGRFLETRFHMPKSYAPLEIPLKKKISEMINRGTVDVYINRNIHKNEKSIHISHQEVVAQKWLKAYRKMAKALQLEDDLSLVDVIRLSPDLLKIEASENIEVFEQTLVEQTFVKAVKACVKERAREGKSLNIQFQELLGELDQSVQVMEQRRAKANLKLKQKYEDRLKKLSKDIKVDPDRVAVEMVIQLDKIDINEELMRLKEHIQAFYVLLKASSKPVGKKMDFYTQEFLREVNTIGSKSQLSQLTSEVVEAKSIVERIREQVQNVE